jgi:hypothetical protein
MCLAAPSKWQPWAARGVVGLGILLAGKVSANEVVLQFAGDGLRMDAAVLDEEARRDSPLHQLLLLYHSVFLLQVADQRWQMQLRFVVACCLFAQMRQNDYDTCRTGQLFALVAIVVDSAHRKRRCVEYCAALIV